ncbi:MAG TPA: hypothetical protein VF294_06805 [Polyangiaceae bacterium]
MASDSERESGTEDQQKAARTSPSSAGDRPKKKKLKRAKLPIPATEDALDSPTKQTVGMLGILGLMTIVMWALARGACNYHPPKETRVPRKVTLEELAHDPKDAAVELQQRLVTHDYAGALELATGAAAAKVQQEKAACDAACLSTRKALSLSVLTSAAILEASPIGATARVTSVGLPGGPKTNLIHLTRAESLWKATELKVDDGVPFQEPVQIPLMPTTPASSASASTSAAPHSSAAPGGSGAPHAAHATPAPATSH